ncbi:sulfatase-like hydrolase/transferase [Nitrospirillum sp. BR 11163]|uniref:sulfatase-like hydrolase/transferase n=1 Tax=Nitrospirillum sp. BR 11163 TaxID=3104323 RepID=UPI002B002F15|nr:sulfatase-like hydrolase/transferase [Nitrospirillum sp. BR 11163]MEA1674843.1 sulfatase-like hydrolase/transferase [Nitrospirillum sp. BR 11163]
MSTSPNILLVTSDQYRFPRFSYGPEGGFAEALKQILGFQGAVDAHNPYAAFFPGLLRLRRNAVVLRNHTIAASACTPSRATIYTGQYGTRTGVTQTDGLFKNGDAANFPWLAPDGIPTLGSWMRAAGYSTHYFGKWHVSNPPDHSLQAYGFDDWEESYPEPHGASPNNLGTYRDIGFADSVCTFLRRKALGLDYDRAAAVKSEKAPNQSAPDASKARPWFAVASFANPHDIATYPAVIAQALPSDSGTPVTLPNGQTVGATQSVFGPLTVPLQGDRTPPPTGGTLQVALNPLGFPQACAHNPPTLDEDLAAKPSCQYDYAYKMGLALSAKVGTGAGGAVPADKMDAAVAVTLKSCIPFQLADDPGASARDFIQLYAYLHAVVDAQIDRVLRTLEESGLAENTIVVFLADHGEYAAAHGMMIEKWHTAYQEALHVPVVVQFPRSAHQVPGGLRQLDQVTSHIDIVPTILGLAGVDQEQTARRLAAARGPVPPLPGANLAPLIRGETDVVTEPDGLPRRGVLFITDDEITKPLPPIGDPHETASYAQFAVFDATVAAVREGSHGKGPVPGLTPGPVRQPNHVRCVRTPDFKLARYHDPDGRVPQEWEMYDLRHDPNETVSLVQVRTSPPTARHDLPGWTTRAAVQADADSLADLLARLEARDLPPLAP